MKKTTSICLFTGMIFLLLVMVVYLLFTQQDTGEKEQDLAAATEEMPAETDTEKELKTTESLAGCRWNNDLVFSRFLLHG